MTVSTTTELEIEENAFKLKRYKHLQQLGEHLKALKDNANFKALIEDAYLERNLKDNVYSLPNITTGNTYEAVLRNIHAIGHLADWLKTVERDGADAELQLDYLEGSLHVG